MLLRSAEGKPFFASISQHYRLVWLRRGVLGDPWGAEAVMAKALSGWWELGEGGPAARGMERSILRPRSPLQGRSYPKEGGGCSRAGGRIFLWSKSPRRRRVAGGRWEWEMAKSALDHPAELQGRGAG